MNALRRLVRGSILSLALLGTVMFVAGPTLAMTGDVPLNGSSRRLVDQTVVADVYFTSANLDEALSHDQRGRGVSEGLLMSSLRFLTPAQSCLPGYVHYWDEETGYEVYLGDILFDEWPKLYGCGWDVEPEVEHIYWEMTGDVGTPSTCSGGRWDCALYVPMYVVGDCDEEATFTVYMWDGDWELVYYDEIFITYSISNNPPMCEW